MWGWDGIFLYYFITINASKNPHADVIYLPIYNLIQFKQRQQRNNINCNTKKSWTPIQGEVE
jgi:hypothetical protein